MLLVIEKTKQLENIFVSQMTLYFNFSSQLMLYITFYQLTFVKDFESNNELRLLLPCKVDMTKFPSSKWLADLKIFNRPILGTKDLFLAAILILLHLHLLANLLNLIVRLTKRVRDLNLAILFTNCAFALFFCILVFRGCALYIGIGLITQ